jgi:hypothetical protein
MNRPDLVALTPDDLAALANRGLVKRAQKECESGDLTAQWSETEDGTIEAKWTDGATCVLPGGKTLKEARCDCAAMELCRHLLRTVLAWQARQTVSEEKAPEVWNPGRITDALIESQTTKTTRDRAKLLWSQGVLAEVLCAVKPSARFHSPGHTVRFPVPDDLRYAQCSCSDPAPCAHAVMAVQAFRLLPAEQNSGIVSEGPLDSPVEREPLDAATDCVRELFANGLATLNTAWRDRVRRIAAESLPWPAQILEELADDFDRYTARDAGFSPEDMLQRCGELLLRSDAILASCAPVPQAFIRGLKADRDSELGSARFIGLGANVIEARGSTSVNVFLQEIDSGHTVTVTREFKEPPEMVKKPFHQLAQASSVKDASLASLAAGQLVTQGGKRTAAGRLVIGRARAVVNPQNFAWEQLKAPLLAEDFTEITARLRLLPPACFRPRRSGGDFHVCPLQAIEAAHFDSSSNAIVALLIDASGQRARLVHPWTQRGQIGADSLLAALQSGAPPVFIAGQVRASTHGLIIHPTALILAGEGTSRRAVLPWIASTQSHALVEHAAATPARIQRAYAPASELLTQLLLQGADRLSKRSWPDWSRSILELEASGHHRMAYTLQQIPTSPAKALPALKWWRLGMEILAESNQSAAT